MPHPDYIFALDNGCRDVSACLGIQRMPEGYALMLDQDGCMFFWLILETGTEGAGFSNKWHAWRNAVAHSHIPQQ